MYASIGIQNGKFVCYDMNEEVFHCLPEQEKIKSDLKLQIKELVNNKLEPLTAKEVIYKALSKVLDCVIDVYFRTASIRESKDPLYTELEKFVCSLDSYKSLIASTRTLRINKSGFCIFDINGLALEENNINQDVLEALKENIDKYVQKNKKQFSVNVILKNALVDYFFVDRVTFICEQNPTVIELKRYITNSDYYRANLIKTCKICFKNGDLKIKYKDEYYNPTTDVTVERLKDTILQYINDNPLQFNLKEIIFSSLEILSGFNSLKKVGEYETVFVGQVKREVLREDPLYLSLVTFIESLPDFQIRLKEKQEKCKLKTELVKKGKRLQYQKNFVDSFTFENKERGRKKAYLSS